MSGPTTHIDEAETRLNAREARQGRRGTFMLMVLIASMLLALALFVVFIFFAGATDNSVDVGGELNVPATSVPAEE